MTACELTAWDSALLARHLAFYEALASGRRQPVTALQAHFVAAVLGQARPSTQHEIAYVRHRDGWSAVPGRVAGVGADVRPDLRVERTVDWIEDARVATAASAGSDILGQVRSLYTSGWAKARRASADAAVWMTPLLSVPSVGDGIARWTSAEFGRLSDVYTRAMDGTFLTGACNADPWLHRLFEGHELLSAWRAVCGAVSDDSLAQEVVGYVRALGSDLVTLVGLPVEEIAPAQFEALRAFLCDNLGLSREWLVDILTYNAVEVTAAAIPLVAAAICWTEADAVCFARLAASVGVGAVVAASPLGAIVAVALLAKAFHAARHRREVMRGALGGGSQAGAVLAASAVVGGPVWLGLIGGVGLAAGIRAAARRRGPLGMDAAVGGLSGERLERGLRALGGWRGRTAAPG